MAIDAPGILDQVNESAELNDIISGNLASTSDKDIYRIASSSVPTDSLLIVDFGGYVTARDNEFLISILDSSGTVLSSTETAQDDTFAQAVSAGGSYYISVEKGSGYDGRTYTITPSVISLTEDEINDEYTSASRLITENTVSGILGTAAVPDATDEDWYYFTTGNTSGSTVDITITTTNEQQNYYDVTLYQSDGEQVVRNGAGEQQSKSVGIAEGSLGFTLSEEGGANAAGTYFVKVAAFDTDTFAARMRQVSLTKFPWAERPTITYIQSSRPVAQPQAWPGRLWRVLIRNYLVSVRVRNWKEFWSSMTIMKTRPMLRYRAIKLSL